MVLASGRRELPLDPGDELHHTQPVALGVGAGVVPSAPPDTANLCEGALLSDRYRVLHPIAGGWIAYDERLSRPVFVAAILGTGELPAERVRREAARGVPLVDAVIAGDAAFAVRAMFHIA